MGGGRYEKGDFAYLVSFGLLVRYQVYFLEGGSVRLDDCQQREEKRETSVFYSVLSGQAPLLYQLHQKQRLII